MRAKLKFTYKIKRLLTNYKYVFRSTGLTKDIEEEPTSGLKILEAESIKAEIFNKDKSSKRLSQA